MRPLSPGRAEPINGDRAAVTVEQVPVYHLACTPDEAAVAVLESILKKGE